MENLITVFVFAMALFSALVAFFFVIGLGREIDKKKKNDLFDDMLGTMRVSEIEVEQADANAPDPKTWTGYWYALSKNGGVEYQNEARPGLMAAGAMLFLFMIGFFIWPGNLFGGILMMPAGPVVLRAYYVAKANQRRVKIDKQLPNLLSGLRANLQANLTPQQSIINQARDFPAPLGDELRIMTSDMAVGIPLDTSLQNFGARSTSRELKFLVASIRIAISSGADLDPLLARIQDILVQRQRIANALATAVAKAQPALWVTGLAIPAGFLWSFFDPKNQEFWLSLTGIIYIGIIAFFYATALVVANKQIKKIKEA